MSILSMDKANVVERGTFLEGDSMFAVTQEVIRNEWQQNGGEGGGDDLREFHFGAIDAINRLEQILMSLQNGRDVELPPASLEDNDKLHSYAYKYPGEVTHYIYGLEQVARIAFAQRGENLKSRRAWLRDFLEHMTGKGDVHNPEVAENAYAGNTRLETNRLSNGIWRLSRTLPGFNRKGPVLLGGVGKGRVEGPAIEMLKEGGEVFDPGVEVVGIDGLPPREHYVGMELREANIEEMVKKFPDLINRMNLLILIGSVTSNMNLIVEQLRYWLQFGGAAKNGAFMYMNLAAIEPLGQQNERWKRSNNFAVSTGNGVVGSLPVNRSYARGSDRPGETGARIQSLSELAAIAKFTKWNLLNIPQRGTPEWRQIMDIANDKVRLHEATQTIQDPMEMPFYLASQTEIGTTVRMDLIFQRDVSQHDSRVKGVELLLQSIFDELLKKQDPLRVSSDFGG